MVTDTQLRSLLRALATLQTLDSDRQGVVIAPDRGGRGTPDADGKRVAQIDRGDVAKAALRRSVSGGVSLASSSRGSWRSRTVRGALTRSHSTWRRRTGR